MIDKEAVIARVLADPYTHRTNTDGGQAAADFIRNFAARQARTPEQKEADRQARVLAVLAEMSA